MPVVVTSSSAASGSVFVLAHALNLLDGDSHFPYPPAVAVSEMCARDRGMPVATRAIMHRELRIIRSEVGTSLEQAVRA
jgi:hypothetical protein